MNQYRFDVSLGRQVPNRFQTGSNDVRPTISFVLKDPLFGHGESFCLRVLDQRRRLARDRVVFLLPVR